MSDNVVTLSFKKPGAAPEVVEVLQSAIDDNPTPTDCVVVLFDATDDGAMVVRRYANRQQLAMAGARLLWLAGCDALDENGP